MVKFINTASGVIYLDMNITDHTKFDFIINLLIYDTSIIDRIY